MQDLTAIVLAAGRGTRMQSQSPKVLHEILGEPLLSYSLRLLSEVSVEKSVVVISGDGDGNLVKASFADLSRTIWARQPVPRGTGDAVAAALKSLENVTGDVLILCGDVPLLQAETLTAFYEKHCRLKAKLSVMTAVLENGGAYGRVLVDESKAPLVIVEARDATPAQLEVKRINSGTYIVNIDLLRRALRETDCNNAQGEYYLTDMVAFARREKALTAIYDVDDIREILGVNSRRDLVRLEAIMASRIAGFWLDNGVTIHAPEQVRIAPRVVLGRDTEIAPGVSLMGVTAVGSGCVLGAGAQINNSTIGDRVEIKPYSVIDEAEIGPQSAIGPFARIRLGSIIAAEVKIGNFVETKKAHFGKGAKASHLSYIGDAEVGAESNLGAGTITCNYDGFNKFKTVIGERVFVGSDSQLVAPVKLGDDVLVGAGSTITRDVQKNAMVTTRVRQKEFAGRGMVWRRHSAEEK